MRSTTSGIGTVFTRPDILPPIPCTRPGVMARIVPAPSEARTAQSRTPWLIPFPINSEAPKPTNSASAYTALSGVHIPNSCIRAWMFSPTASDVISRTGNANLSARGHELIAGGPTSTTFPSRITILHLPIASMMCSSPAMEFTSYYIAGHLR